MISRIAATALAGWWFGVAPAAGQGEPRPAAPLVAPVEETAAPKTVLTAELETKDGRKASGTVALEGDEVVVQGEESLRVKLENVAALGVTLETIGGKKPEKTILSGGLPAPWRNLDVGRLVIPGKARWKDHQFTLLASPRAEGENFAAFHMVCRPVTGDCEIVARVVEIANPDEDSCGGVIMTDGLHAENRKALLSVQVHGERKVNFRRWGYAGGSSTGKEEESIVLPYWLKLVREGMDVKAYYSPDGRRWRFLKNSPGKMRDEQIYVGIVARVQKFNRLSETVIDHVSVNGKGSKPAEPKLPHLVLRSGSRLAADIAEADGTAFRLKGRWAGSAITAPNLARVEFYHPLPEEYRPLVTGERTGLLLRSGDFSEGQFQSVVDGRVKLSSVLFGLSEHSILDEVDALVFRREVAPAVAPAWRLETQAGSVLLAQEAKMAGGKLAVEVDGLGRASFAVEEIRSLVPLTGRADRLGPPGLP